MDSRDTIQHYICHSCNKRYSAFDALQLVSYTDDYFHCETCNGELVAVSDKLASEETGDGEDNVRKCRSDKLKDMQQRIDVSIQFLTPHFIYIIQITAAEKIWQHRAIEAVGCTTSESEKSAFANGCSGADDSYKSSTLITIPGNKLEVIIDSGKDVGGKDDPGKDFQATGNTAEANKLEAQESGYEDDDYEWVEG